MENCINDAEVLSPSTTYAIEKMCLYSAIRRFLSSDQNASDIVSLMIAGSRYIPVYSGGKYVPEVDDAPSVLTKGVHFSDIYTIMQKLEIPGDYNKIAKCLKNEKALLKED